MNQESGIKNWRYGSLFILIVFFFLFMILNSSFIIPASAQQAPELLLSWQANNTVPPDYQGKILPINGTRVNLGVDLLENNRLMDISSYVIRWYVNDDLKTSGKGLRSFSFVADSLGGNDSIKVVAVGYKGNDASKTIIIPIADPEIVIDAPFPDNLIAAGVNKIKALLYFFNISGLDQVNFTWTANGVVEEDASNVLDLDAAKLPSGSRINLNVQAQNTHQILETASASTNLTIR